MSRTKAVCWLALWAGCCTATGCQFVPRSQLSASENRGRALAEQSQAQLAEIANLRAHNRTVEDRLIKAEEELALLEEQAGLEHKRVTNYESERERLNEQLDGLVADSTGLRAGSDRRLRELCQRYPALRYDPRSGICKLDTDVLFETGEASLAPESRQKLNELVRLLKSAEARNFRVMVVGHTDNRQVAKRDTRERYPDNWYLSTARALHVAEYLQHQGLREDQVGVAGYGRHEPIASNTTAANRHRNRRVEIFILSPETPIVGWTETTTSVYR
ncbi:MAG TPA: OmpA family protein [Pirellulales bacterium]|jgi:chemotaxis protein MotB|nr:OmpA family protein [Pirellulales bacterium]